MTEGLQAELDAALAEMASRTAAPTRRKEAYNQALANARRPPSSYASQWRNKCIDSTYEPGSTFKPMTLATALEEGLVTMASTFTCTGSTHGGGLGKPINCSKRAGHGTQTLKVAVATPATRPSSPWA